MLRLLLATAALLCAASSASAQYPDRPVRIIVPYSAGGTSDFVARITAQKLSELTGKTFYVENKPGASGRLGYETGTKATPDGYTLVGADTSFAMLPGLYAKLPWTQDTALRTITITAQTPVVIAVHPKTGFKTLRDLIVYAKANPGKLNYGSGGVGSSTHLAGELFKRVAGVDIAHVPYKGAGDAVTGLVSGQVELLITAPPTVISLVRAGNLTALAVTSVQRSAALPDVPSVVEAGLPGFIVSNWFGLMAPKDTPDAIVDYLQKEVATAMAADTIKERLRAQGAEPVASAPQASAQKVSDETKLWTDVVHDAGIKVE
ncbi:MAG TPA: tripartite tricarboxylate transporter substrate binding protein [Pseudolabrys sp.]|nr:tripartite tricarboxylate transporter substrate binding protein [Pseudolabrys sp.]